jgi:DNA invertase Pin-like site-specific DNA recombinase
MTIRSTRRTALYLRVSTDKQTVENQEIQLRQVAERRGWEVVEVYDDAGISGSKGRADRPGLDQMLNDATRRHFNIVLVWAIDRLGRSLIDLLGTIQHLEAVAVDLYIDQQSIDTSTPMGKLIFSVCGAFAQFERSMIQQHSCWLAEGTSSREDARPPQGRRSHPGGDPGVPQEGRRHQEDRGGARLRNRNCNTG